MTNVKIQAPVKNVATQIKYKKVQRTFNVKKLFQFILIFLAVILFAVANVYNNRWGRSVTELDKKISQIELKLENAKILNQELTNKTRLQSAANGKVNMHYDVDSNVVVSEFK